MQEKSLEKQCNIPMDDKEDWDRQRGFYLQNPDALRDAFLRPVKHLI